MSSQTTMRSQSVLPRSPAQHKHHVKLQIGLVSQSANAQRHVTCRNILQNAGGYAKPLQDLDTWSKLASIQEDELSITYEMYGLHVSHVVGFELTFRDARGVTQQLLLTDSKELQFAIGTLQQLFISCKVTKAVGNCPACIKPPMLNILFEDEYFSSAVYPATGDASLRELYNWDEEVPSDFSFQSMLGEDTYDDTPALTELDLGIEDQWPTSEPSLTQESTPPSQLLRRIPDTYIKPSLLVKRTTARSGIYINPAGERTTSCPPLPFLPPSSTMTTSPSPLPSSSSQEPPSTSTPAPTLTPASAPVPAPTVVTPFHGCDPKTSVDGHKSPHFECLTCAHYERRCTGTAVVGGKCDNCRGLGGRKARSGGRSRVCYWPQPEKGVTTYEQARQAYGGRRLLDNTTAGKREKRRMENEE